MKKRIALESSVGWEMGDSEVKQESFAPDKDMVFAPGGILPVYVSDSDAKAYLDSTNGQIQAVGRDIITNSALFKTDFITNWNTFTTEWKIFYDKNKTDYHILDTVACMNQTDLYVERTKQYQLQAKSLGGPTYIPTAPGVIQDPNSVINPTDSPQTLMKTAIIGAGVILGGLIVLKVLDYVPKPAHELRRAEPIKEYE